jgi:hypothetical protein
MAEKSRILRPAAFIISVLVLVIPAIILGYPILHGDSGSYIVSGFRLHAPVERPITYGIFVWLTSLSVSLWFVILAQSLLTVYVLHVFLKRLYGQSYNPLILLFLLIPLGITTGAGYFVCQIKPDFFLPLIILSICAFLVGNGQITREDILLALITMTGLLAHLSHIPIVTGLIIAIFCLLLIFRQLRVENYSKKFLVLFVFICSAWLIAPSINYVFTGSFTFSRVNNIFSTSRLLQAGIFQDYVSERCETDSTFSMCKYRYEMADYKQYYDFLWDKESFLYDHDCFAKGKLNCWLARDKEFGVIVKEIYSRKEYRIWMARDAVHTSVTQFFSFGIPDYASYQRHSYPMEMARKYLPYDNKFIINASQGKRDLIFPVQNFVQLIMVIASLFVIFFFMIWHRGRTYDAKLKLTGLIVMLILLGNAAFIGIFAGPSDRFQGRLIWLVPLFAILLIFRLALRGLSGDGMASYENR